MPDHLPAEPASFFVPVGIGILTQMFCAGLVTAVVAFGFRTQGSREPVTTASPAIESNGPAVDGTQTESAEQPEADGGLLQEQVDGAAGSAPSDAAAETTNAATAATNSPLESPVSPGAADPAGAENAAGISAVPAAQPAVADQARPLDDIRTRSRLLPIAGEGVPENPALCQITVDDVTTVKLELIGAEFQESPVLTLKLQPQVVQGKSGGWKVSQEAETGFDRIQEVGEFQFKDQQFSFVWSKNADKGKLPFCKLKITAVSDSEVCSLFTPVRSAALGVNFNNRVEKMTSFVPPGVQMPSAESLKLEMTMEGWPEHQQEGDFLVVNKAVKLSFENAESKRDLLRILLTLKVETGQLGVHAAFFTDVPRSATQRTKSVEDIRLEEKPFSHNDLEKIAKDMKKEVTQYQVELDTIDVAVKKLQAAQDNVERQLANGFNQALAAEQSILERKMEQLKDKQAAAEEFHDFYADADAAATALQELCGKLESDARIHFRLIRPFNGGETVIASSVNATP